MTDLGVVHPRMLAGLAAFYPTTCTIQNATVTRGETGEEIKAWSNVMGLTSLACRLAPAGGQEVKRTDQTYVVASHVVALASYQPTILETQRVVIGSQAYDILLVEHDGQSTTTRLQCKVVR